MASQCNLTHLLRTVSEVSYCAPNCLVSMVVSVRDQELEGPNPLSPRAKKLQHFESLNRIRKVSLKPSGGVAARSPAFCWIGEVPCGSWACAFEPPAPPFSWAIQGSSKLRPCCPSAGFEKHQESRNGFTSCTVYRHSGPSLILHVARSWFASISGAIVGHRFFQL